MVNVSLYGKRIKELETLARELVGCLTQLNEEELGDWVYDIRERELRGWDGPRVKSWSAAVQRIKPALEKAAALGITAEEK